MARDEQVMGPIKHGGAPAGDLCRGLDGVVEGVYHLEDERPELLNM